MAGNTNLTSIGALCDALKDPVQLFDKKIDSLEAPPHSFDVILSISALEHFPDADLAKLASAMRRLLKPDGILVMTIDLFLDLKPFSEREENEWGRNLDIRQSLNMAGLTPQDGNPAELLGFPEFNPTQTIGNLGTYLIGEGYPALSNALLLGMANTTGRRRVLSPWVFPQGLSRPYKAKIAIAC